jgi:hypothetical protein
MGAASRTDDADTTQSIRDQMKFSRILASSICPKTAALGNSLVHLSPDTLHQTTTLVRGTMVDHPDTISSKPGQVEKSTEFIHILAEGLIDDNREFICRGNAPFRCYTGQYTKELSRKVISNYFGRNKACTRNITEWPLFCRKHYQRASYNKKVWQTRKLKLIVQQLNMIEKKHPGTTYNIQVKKSEQRLLEMCARPTSFDISENGVEKSIVQSEWESLELSTIHEFYTLLGDKKSFADAQNVAERILGKLKDGTMKQLPSIEFLPRLSKKIKC